ncbi:FdhD protein [Bacillus ectoiniformans]|uniref:formate dehydrogenase accessory sulfurtransferase FdhD n=1 Tax=Bacillus ectoiniformans TaxID=1494429 RepID=UPI0023BA74EF|nr:formate dehydrogenase accessory sulfurtransferase FdhD [Bacillus ectoiniformans]MBM7649163.1 FdhD protein [Bacillus ectoiniformans]
MERPIIHSRKILRIKNGKPEWCTDKVATEQAITIKLNGEEFVTMVCTPQYIEDMAVGYLASEGIIRTYRDIQHMRVDGKQGFVHIESSHINPLYKGLQNKRYLTSCCGGSRQGFVFASDAMSAKRMTERNVRLSPEDCTRLMNEMQNGADTFKQTGGVHNAALCDVNGIVLSRMDIGRHNALDKIYGYCLMHNISVRDKVIVFSGRLSSEILLKVAKIGCEIVLSKSAPTERALTLAEELEITTVGFIRKGNMNVYTFPERIVID